MLNRTSRQARKASRRESNTREIIGTMSFHMFFLTLEKMPWPSSSHPDNQTLSPGSRDSNVSRRATDETASVDGLRKPRT